MFSSNKLQQLFDLAAAPNRVAAYLNPAGGWSIVLTDWSSAIVAQGIMPGLLLSLAVGVASFFLSPLVGRLAGQLVHTHIEMPTAVIALLLGVLLHPFAQRVEFTAGINWCIKALLRFAVALLGLHIALADILGLGLGTVLLVLFAMALTLAVGMALSALLGRDAGYGALAGAATAVCGASAALATAAVLPDYKRRQEDLAFTIIMANLVSTLVMVAYPPICVALGLSPRSTGILLGATIHDMAQVAGSGYSVSLAVGDIAVVVKLLRIFLLLPVIISIGWWFSVVTSQAPSADARSLRPPTFAISFLILCLINSVCANSSSLAIVYAPIKWSLGHASSWGLLIAIAALGLGTSLKSILSVDVRHILVFAGTTLTILVAIMTGLVASG